MADGMAKKTVVGSKAKLSLTHVREGRLGLHSKPQTLFNSKPSSGRATEGRRVCENLVRD